MIGCSARQQQGQYRGSGIDDDLFGQSGPASHLHCHRKVLPHHRQSRVSSSRVNRGGELDSNDVVVDSAMLAAIRWLHCGGRSPATKAFNPLIDPLGRKRHNATSASPLW